MVQLRLKYATSHELLVAARTLVAALPVPVIVNDRADVALAAGAAGVHLGVDDLPVAAVRAMAPADFIIGASFGSEAELAHARDADYVGIGPVYGTASKEDAGEAIGVAGFERLRRLIEMPAVAIGGVDEGNAEALRGAGAAGIAVIRALFGAPDPEDAARRLRRGFGA
jgi:thiamine-phosphate pyrophosphorylase